MTTALQIVQIIFHSVAIIFMLCFIFIGIWSFIVFLKMAKNQRIQTYLLEKINKSICSLENNHKKNNPNLDSDFLMENLITDDTDEDDNIIKFDDNII
ncbi:MAG: hypothetical protein ACLU6S_09540 [Clostridium sp.]|uniref:hypothetical protein n=1 Tax=Clostridium sp. TaxID=1506 RepID=UPI00399A0D2D